MAIEIILQVGDNTAKSCRLGEVNRGHLLLEAKQENGLVDEETLSLPFLRYQVIYRMWAKSQ